MQEQAIDVLIVGGGPAGLAAALAIGCHRHNVTLFDNESPRITSTSSFTGINMLPAWSSAHTKNYILEARRDIRDHYPTVTLVDATIVKAEKVWAGDIMVTNSDGKCWVGKKLVIATGYEDMLPDIPGYKEAWGKSIFHNLAYQGREAPRVGLLADNPAEIGLYHAKCAAQLANRVTIYTNGDDKLQKLFIGDLLQVQRYCHKFFFDNRRIISLQTDAGDTTLAKDIRIQLEDDTIVTEAFLVHTPQLKVKDTLKFSEDIHLELARDFNAKAGDSAARAPHYQTVDRGIFVAGDLVTRYKHMASAISSGCNVGISASIQLLQEKYEDWPHF
ncbi:thioredoxin reductase glit-like protein [Aspergillus ellipticus CBS 707.79]|uniref:Thioredoxin reductase glit-like protein n=1 Tax=Aspergillus ellipticus CBS 707.79 TaxID=1448320 RepID=A0A319CUT2_9EURO|nr:thioredoxin reductase glit-like protein [Aspergillus ellipticus CBS 707.79]